MSDSSELAHSAGPSMVGYLFQCRFALFEMLKRFPDNPTASLTIETLDDVVFEKDGRPSEIIQLKHHLNRGANLTNASVDLWNTIAVWLDLSAQNELSDQAALAMITTAQAPSGTVAFYLTQKNRNLDLAVQNLRQTAQTSTNKETERARADFLKLTDSEQGKLLSNAFVVDCTPQCDDLEQNLLKQLYFACARDKSRNFLSYLEGWWFGRVVKSLSGAASQMILGEELEAQLTELREAFRNEALPIHDDIKAATVDDELYQDYTFVHQLRFIDIGRRRISIAVNNYYRAFEQRSRWMREELLFVGDIEKYESALIEEWEVHFERMKEALGAEATEDEKVKAAQDLYAWVETEADVPIRDNCREPFMTRGSYHILSNKKAVGWHLEFLARLEDLLRIKKDDT